MSEEMNPYLPPASDVHAPAAAMTGEVAGNGRRFGTLVIDYVCFFISSVAVGAFVGIVFGQRGVEYITNMPSFILGSAIYFVFYGVFEGIWARTPGKYAFGTVVVNEEGGKPTFGQVMTRTACRFIPFEAFSFFGERGWHDSISKTRVVLVRRD